VPAHLVLNGRELRSVAEETLCSSSPTLTFERRHILDNPEPNEMANQRWRWSGSNSCRWRRRVSARGAGGLGHCPAASNISPRTWWIRADPRGRVVTSRFAITPAASTVATTTCAPSVSYRNTIFRVRLPPPPFLIRGAPPPRTPLRAHSRGPTIPAPFARAHSLPLVRKTTNRPNALPRRSCAQRARLAKAGHSRDSPPVTTRLRKSRSVRVARSLPLARFFTVGKIWPSLDTSADVLAERYRSNLPRIVAV
jgi:hypothetical protein